MTLLLGVPNQSVKQSGMVTSHAELDVRIRAKPLLSGPQLPNVMHAAREHCRRVSHGLGHVGEIVNAHEKAVEPAAFRGEAACSAGESKRMEAATVIKLVDSQEIANQIKDDRW